MSMEISSRWFTEARNLYMCRDREAADSEKARYFHQLAKQAEKAAIEIQKLEAVLLDRVRQTGRTSAQLESVLDYVATNPDGAIYVVASPAAAGYTVELLSHLAYKRGQTWLVDRVTMSLPDQARKLRGEKRCVFYDHAAWR